MAEEAEVPAGALVIRFRPTAPDRVLASALKEYRRADHYGCSVFADVQRPDETEADLIARLLAEAELDGIDPTSHPKFFVCGEADRLLEQGFVFMKDGGTDEMEHHYCVSLGKNQPDEATAERFLSAFDRTEKRNR